MSKNEVLEIINKIRGLVGPNEYISTFVFNYYLSRKLKSVSFKEIVDHFNDEIITTYLVESYESENNLVNEFQKLSDYSKSEFLEILIILSENLGRYGSELFTPLSLTGLGLSILDLNKEDVFLDYGSGIGSTLLTATDHTMNVTGLEINNQSYAISKVLLDLFSVSNENIVNADAFKYMINKHKANKVFMNMPLSMRIPGPELQKSIDDKFNNPIYKNIIKPIDVTWLLALDVLENTEFEKFVMYVSGAPLYSDAHLDIRKQIVNQQYIESVVALPSNILPYTGIPVYLVVFSKNNKSIRFVDGTKLYRESKYRNILDKNHIDTILEATKINTEISKTKMIEELKEEEYALDPIRYTAPKFPFENSIHLKEVMVSINRGATINKKELEKLTSEVPTNYQYLMLNDFQDGILADKLTYLKDIDSEMEKYLVKNNSIIISRISPFKIGTVDKLKTNILGNGNLFIIEIDEKKINKDFLTAYLQSKIGLSELEKYAKGSVMKTISIRDLEKIKIPDLSIENQKEIAAKFNLLNAEFKAIKKRTKEITKERLNLFEGGIWCS